jgi:tRNA (guanosine-2'-O-)-methyltransferase
VQKNFNADSNKIYVNPSREKKIRDAVRHTQSDLTVILENIFDPLNISAVMRSCDAVGIREIFVVYTQNYLDKRGLVLGKRTSGGTFKWMDVYVFEDLEECFRRVKARYGRVLATMPNEQSHSLYELDLAQPTALLFGNEDEGISSEAVALSDGFFTIPQAGFAESLNISVACAVTLYEAYRQRAKVGRYSDQPCLNDTEQAQLFQRWSAMLKSDQKRNRGIWVRADDAPIPPLFVERDPSLPPDTFYSLPKTRFDL